MDCQDDEARTAHSAKLAELNDQLRREMPHGRVLLTRAVADLDPAIVLRIVRAVRTFDKFERGNDPWGEHDFGQVTVERESYFWSVRRQRPWHRFEVVI